MFCTPGHEAGDQVELAFADDGEAGVEDGALGFVEAEEDLALGEDRRLRRVDVLGRLLVAGQHAPAEADHPALLVADRETSAGRETGRSSDRAPSFANDQSGLFDERQFVALCSSPS